MRAHGDNHACPCKCTPAFSEWSTSERLKRCTAVLCRYQEWFRRVQADIFAAVYADYTLTKQAPPL
jgi:hypothetical protein